MASGSDASDTEAFLPARPPRLAPTSCRTVLALSLALLTLLSVGRYAVPSKVVATGSSNSLSQKFKLLDAWRLISGAQSDPFNFRCPMTVFQRMAAAAWLVKKLKVTAAEATTLCQCFGHINFRNVADIGALRAGAAVRTCPHLLEASQH